MAKAKAKQKTAKERYEQIKKAHTRKRGRKDLAGYDEEFHCPLIISVFEKQGTVSQFCLEADISDSTFWNWVNRNPIFRECYRLGVMISEAAWEKEGLDNRDNPEFNMDYWKTIGQKRFGLGKGAKIRLGVDAAENPYIQYQQIIQQAQGGEFTSAEFKQIMEAINVGVRAHEAFELQEQINEMKIDLGKMAKNDGAHYRPNQGIAKAN